jgi:hypothetical protein
MITDKLATALALQPSCSPFPIIVHLAAPARARARSCFYTIDLPAYTILDACYNRLFHVITYCNSIDGDGSMQERQGRGAWGEEDEKEEEEDEE